MYKVEGYRAYSQTNIAFRDVTSRFGCRVLVRYRFLRSLGLRGFQPSGVEFSGVWGGGRRVQGWRFVQPNHGTRLRA